MQDQTITLTFKKLMDFSDLPKEWGVTTISFDWDFQPLLLVEEGKPPRPQALNDMDAMIPWLNAKPTAHHALYGREPAACKSRFKILRVW